MDKRTLTKILITTAIIAALFFPSVMKYIQMRAKEEAIEDRLKAAKIDMKRMETEKKRLETDVTYVEERARARLGVVRKGEIVIKGQSQKK